MAAVEFLIYLLLALLPIVGAAIGWGFWLAYRTGGLLTAVSHELQDHDRRLRVLEGTPTLRQCLHVPS